MKPINGSLGATQQGVEHALQKQIKSYKKDGWSIEFSIAKNARAREWCIGNI